MRERRFPEAAQALAEAVQQAPSDVALWRLLGGARVASGDPYGALDAFERALALEPTEPKNHYNLALALQAAGDRVGARQHYRHTLSLDPQHEQAALRLQELEEAPPVITPAITPPIGYFGQQQTERTQSAPPVNGSLVLAWGVIGLVILPLFSPLAWQLGNRALEILNRYPDADQTQRSNVVAGRALGIIGTVLLLMMIALLFLVVLVAR